MSLNKKAHITLSLIIIIVLSAALITSLPITQGKITYFAKVVKYPLPSIPEPVLQGGLLEVRIALDKTAKLSGFEAFIYNDFADATLEFVKVSYNSTFKSWHAYFKIPSDIRPGLYNLKVKFIANGNTYEIEEPISVWILKKWPKVLRMILSGDTKTPAGRPYLAEFVRVVNLLSPDLMVFDGDEVERPSMASAWLYFLDEWLKLRVPSYAVIGNHEYDSPGVAKAYEIILGYRNYSIIIGDFLFLMLDTGMDGWIPVDQLKWAESILAKYPDKAKIIVMHHPLFGYKIKDEKIEVVKVSSVDDFDKLFEQGYIYGSWKDHKEEAKYLFKLILEYDVRLILTAHTHTDINNIVVDWKGKKHYFITPSGVPYDVRDYDIRGFRYVIMYANDNGTILENTLTYAGKKLNEYPNSIPIDLGEKVEPYKIGLIEYYYAPANDGKHYAVSFRAKNELAQGFDNIRIIFKLPKDKDISAYKWIPEKPPAYEVIEHGDYKYVILYNVSLPARSVVKYTLAAIDDKDTPSASVKLTEKGKKWFIFEVVAVDKGWGVDEVKFTYSVDGGKTWLKPALYDFIEAKEDGSVKYLIWIKAPPEGTESIKYKVTVVDFAGHSKTIEGVIQLVTPTTTPTTTPTVTTPTTTPTPTPTVLTVTKTVTKTITEKEEVTVIKTHVETKTVTKREEMTLTKPVLVTKTSIVKEYITLTEYKRIPYGNPALSAGLASLVIILAVILGALLYRKKTIEK